MMPFVAQTQDAIKRLCAKAESHTISPRHILQSLVCTSVVALAACSESGGGAAASTNQAFMMGEDLTARECDVPSLNQWVDDSMRDFYLFADQVPVVDLADFDSPESLIRDLRVLPDTFSSVTNATTSAQIFDEGLSFGIGFVWRFDSNNVPRILFIQDDAPSAAAGMRRGDAIISVNGEDWATLSFSRFQTLIGTREEPREARFELISAITGETYFSDVTPAEYSINTVLHDEIINVPNLGSNIGYLAFNSFLETSEAELQDVFSRFQAANVNELVLDLRYNGGGRTRIARLLAALISSPTTDGELLIEYRFNDRYTSRNFSRIFANVDNALGLGRVVILTTGSTASSSEIVINSLKPYIDVVTIGSTTVGKPFISSGRDLCDRRINAMEAEGFNAAGVSVSGGITADCIAQDDLTRDFGTNENGLEGMLQSAYDFIVAGTCDTVIQATISEDSRDAAALSTNRLLISPIMTDTLEPVPQNAQEPALEP